MARRARTQVRARARDRPGPDLGAELSRRERGRLAVRRARRDGDVARDRDPARGAPASRRERAPLERAPVRAARARPGPRRRRLARAARRRIGVPELGGPTTLHKGSCMRRAVCVTALAAVLGVAGCGGDDSKPLIAASKTAVVRGELVPDVHLFGEPVEAQVDVILNREKVDPAAVQLKANFEPYENVGETRETRQDIGDFTVIRYATTLRCLRETCIPPTAAGETTVSQLPGLPPFLPGQQRDEKVKYEFPPATLLVDAAPKDKTIGRVVWAPLRSLSRINWDDSSVVGQG